ncbi:ACT domain-containing protein [Deinococcus malanensis]|uniref:ACT domain-containing protein n=1 Tax=Deinococcus malanensis TaxID=1706855 RepID=UPI001E2ED105|nr:ACT domain-containing protein [Deinococcus malanensis]
MSPSLSLSLLPAGFAVAQLPIGGPFPAPGGSLFSLTLAADECSLVCEEHLVPEGARAQRGWVALKLHGPFEFSLTGILASVLNPLRDAGVGIFALSTFNTDYVLVARNQLPATLTTLRNAGHTVLGTENAAGA